MYSKNLDLIKTNIFSAPLIILLTETDIFFLFFLTVSVSSWRTQWQIKKLLDATISIHTVLPTIAFAQLVQMSSQ